MAKSKRFAKLWYKNYVLSILLFSLVFYCCVFVLAINGYRTKLSSIKTAAESEEYAVASALSRTFSEIDRTRYAVFAQAFGEHFYQRGAYLSIRANARELYSRLPPGAALTQDASPTLRIVSIDGAAYVQISEALGSGASLIYLKPVENELRGAALQMLHLVCFGFFVTSIMSVGLYWLFRRINRPIDNLAHEMRTPLTAIGGFAEYLQTARLSDLERYEAAQFIIDESARLRDMTERLLTMANLRDGALAMENVRIETLFANTQKTFPHIRVTGGDTYIRGDAALLQSLINNLTANARKASADGAEIVLLASPGRIEVADTGRGMTQDVRLRANDPSSAMRRSGGGSGLGIPLCHEIARLHGARLHYESAEGRGTRAIVEFTALLQAPDGSITSAPYAEGERSDTYL